MDTFALVLERREQQVEQQRGIAFDPLARARALLDDERVHGGEDPQSSFVHESGVYRTQLTRKRRVHGDAERDRLAVHRAPRGDDEVRERDEALCVDRVLGDQDRRKVAYANRLALFRRAREHDGLHALGASEPLEHLGRDDGVHAVVIPRTEEQRAYVRSLALPSVIVPERAVDAQSLIGLSDLVVSAGGTMNREAVALGVPVYTTYGGRLGGVDEWLIREGRLVPLTDPRVLQLRKRERSGPEGDRVRRNPETLLNLLLAAQSEP